MTTPSTALSRQADLDLTDGVNQTLEGAFVGSERSVKRHDLNNNKPLFREIADAGGPAADTTALTYTVDESGGRLAQGHRNTPPLAFDTALEVLPAQDVAEADPDGTDNDEDDSAIYPCGLGNDRLTYSLERG